MTPAELAEIHRAAFSEARPWSAGEFETLLNSDHVSLHTEGRGFALCRTLAGETELLTIAVHPIAQRMGTGRALLQRWLAAAHPAAQRAFLEVAADNGPAQALYAHAGFAEIARRRGYYARTGAAPVDAVVMERAVTFGQGTDSLPFGPESG